MDKQAKLALLKELKSKIADSEEALDNLYSVFGSNPEGPLQSAIYGLTTFAVKATAAAIGDKYGWLEWFVFENEWGSKGLGVVIEDKPMQVTTLGELLNMMDWKETQ